MVKNEKFGQGWADKHEIVEVGKCQNLAFGGSGIFALSKVGTLVGASRGMLGVSREMLGTSRGMLGESRGMLGASREMLG